MKIQEAKQELKTNIEKLNNLKADYKVSMAKRKKIRQAYDDIFEDIEARRNAKLDYEKEMETKKKLLKKIKPFDKKHEEMRFDIKEAEEEVRKSTNKLKMREKDAYIYQQMGVV